MSGFGGVAQLRIQSDSTITSSDSTSDDDRTLESPEGLESPPALIPTRSVRSISLNSALKKADRRGDKKAVHFADSLGLDLVNVHPLQSSGYSSFEDLFSSTPPLYFNGYLKIIDSTLHFTASERSVLHFCSLYVLLAQLHFASKDCYGNANNGVLMIVN
ncbi:unnamed protein product [Gongylonema pulchrum]|uniref:Myosin motor domain-containing protein n=1 Tax=Gongylonema pulchrum TaxID=637853 RepID=A0A183D4E1_9BILA|nr:unnamed protein product [Gongylonema pulchrum]